MFPKYRCLRYQSLVNAMMHIDIQSISIQNLQQTNHLSNFLNDSVSADMDRSACPSPAQHSHASNSSQSQSITVPSPNDPTAFPSTSPTGPKVHGTHTPTNSHILTTITSKAPSYFTKDNCAITPHELTNAQSQRNSSESEYGLIHSHLLTKQQDGNSNR